VVKKEALPKYATLWQGCYPAEKLPGMDSIGRGCIAVDEHYQRSADGQ
jgi:hypothetical protein